ncbi:hypothetical protein FACS1894187_10470 [Synergistales bacterium]|nr:hypothetical protein FACS1894187_10470 [Synergistales bacterium]
MSGREEEIGGEGVNKETLRAYLHNKPLVQTVAQKRAVDDTRHELIKALTVLRTVNIGIATIKEVQAKIDEYAKISKHYGILLEDAFGVSWHKENIIKEYANCLDGDIDALPNEVKE